jgi:DUF4097 and DUF4098 domain-containing protein YvlB
MKRLTILTILILSMVFLNLQAGEKLEVNKTFKAKETVKIKTVSGDCIVKKGKSGEIKVHVMYTYPADKFKPIFEEEGNTLILKEDFAKGKGSIKGKSSWTVTVPEKTDIAFKAASGDFSAAGLKGKMHVKMASGDATLKNINGDLGVELASGDARIKKVNGDVKVSAASGDIEIGDSKGSFKVKCASGDIEASGIALTGESEFKGVSGSVDVVLAESSRYDMGLHTVSGDIVLDYNGNAIKGYFTFKGQKGNIDSAVPFDSKDGSKYNPFIKAYFKKGGDSPKVSLKTVSGDIKLKK